jgi:hypothetical protein
VGAFVILAVLLPLVYLAWLVRAGRVTDMDVRVREQRARPMMVTLGCGALGWAVMALGKADPLLLVVAGALWLELLLLHVITLRWKISVHCAVAAGVGTLTWGLMGTAVPLVLGLPLVAWSRLRLRRHTLAQTVVGSLLGIVIYAIVLSYIAHGGA